MGNISVVLKFIDILKKIWKVKPFCIWYDTTNTLIDWDYVKRLIQIWVFLGQLLHVVLKTIVAFARCEMKHVLLEMDRILRPKGHALIRESSFFVDAIATIAKVLRWDCHKKDAENGAEKEKILVCQKKLWYSSNSGSR